MNDHYILFTIAGTTYALSSREVAHLELLDEVTRVPNAAPHIDGVVFSRGSVVPAVNLRVRFGFDRAAYDARSRLIVVQADGRSVGFVVDAAREFATIPPEAIHAPAEGLTSASGRYLRGVATLGDRMVLVLDIADLMNADDLVTADATAAPRPAQET